MDAVTTFFRANIIFIYFVYGLAHFVMGLAVALETGRASQLRLSRALPFLAAFGITHGINEWIEMFSRLAVQVPSLPQEPLAWGLLGVQERVALVGGKFQVESEPGRGTRLTVEIPVAE